MSLALGLKKLLGWAAAVLPLCLCAAATPDAPAGGQQTNELPARLQAAQTRLAKVSGSLNATDRDLSQLTNSVSLDLTALKAQAQMLADQQAVQRKALADLEGQIDLLRKAWQTKPSKTNAPLSDLQKQVKEAQRELERLAQEEARVLAQAGNQATSTTLGRTKILDRDMRPLNVAFIRSRILPVRAPYYQAVMNSGGSSPFRLVPQQGAGELIGQATKLGGCLDLYLKDSSPKSHYFHFWVCPDSIAAFHAARQFALTNKYAYTWSTYDGSSFGVGGAAAATKVRGTGGTK